MSTRVQHCNYREKNAVEEQRVEVRNWQQAAATGKIYKGKAFQQRNRNEDHTQSPRKRSPTIDGTQEGAGRPKVGDRVWSQRRRHRGRCWCAGMHEEHWLQMRQ